MDKSKALLPIYKSHYSQNRFVLFLILFIFLILGGLVTMGNILTLIDITIIAIWFAIYMFATKLTSPFVAHSIIAGTSLSTSIWFSLFSWKQKTFRWPLIAQIIGVGFAIIVLPSIAQAYLASGLL